MLRYTSSTLARRSNPITAARRYQSSNPLEADSGKLATRVGHTIALVQPGLFPAWWLMPQDSSISRGVGVIVAASLSVHAWIGMNYVATDYVPKVSKKLLGPARIFNAGLCGITLLGLTKLSLSGPGGIKGAIKGLWNPLPKDEE